MQDVGFGATAYRIARALVVETQFEADLVAEFAPRDRIHVVPPGIDLDAWDQGTPERVPGLPDRYFLYAGRIASNKGLPTLFRALARIPSERRWPLVIMGRDWGEGRHLEALAGELGMTSSIHWLGHVPEAQRHRAIFFGAGAVVLPSEYEAFGLVLLEAMAARVPIVASAVGGVPEVLENGRCGRLVPYGDVEAWTRALSEIDDRCGGAGGVPTSGKGTGQGPDLGALGRPSPGALPVGDLGGVRPRVAVEVPELAGQMDQLFAFRRPVHQSERGEDPLHEPDHHDRITSFA